MDLGRLDTLETSLRESVQLRTRYLCLYETDCNSMQSGRVLNIGLDYCIFYLRNVGTGGKHSLLVTTATLPPKLFRETRRGWFVVDHVADHVVEAVGREAALRGEVSRTRQRIQAARTSVRQSGRESAVDMNVNAEAPNLVDITFRGVSDYLALKMVDAWHQDQMRTSAHIKEQRTIWSYLTSDD